jgi:hypothetical protein
MDGDQSVMTIFLLNVDRRLAVRKNVAANAGGSVFYEKNKK